MIYVYDIVLNWTDENKLFDFYEWDLSDDLEHIKKIPFFKISTKSLSEIIKSDIKVDRDFLNKIENLTEVYTARKIEKIMYSVLLSDGFRVIALEFNEKGKSMYKSNLLLDEEDDVIALSTKVTLSNIKYEIEKKNESISFTTRFEEKVKKLLLTEIKNSYKKGDFDKLKYLYIECFDKYSDDIDYICEELITSIDTEINSNHNKLYEVIKMSYQNKS